MGTEPRTLDEIRKIDLEALRQALGPVGMVRFLQYTETGSGDYSAERGAWLGELSLDEIVDAIEEGRREAGNG